MNLIRLSVKERNHNISWIWASTTGSMMGIMRERPEHDYIEMKDSLKEALLKFARDVIHDEARYQKSEHIRRKRERNVGCSFKNWKEGDKTEISNDKEVEKQILENLDLY